MQVGGQLQSSPQLQVSVQSQALLQPQVQDGGQLQSLPQVQVSVQLQVFSDISSVPFYSDTQNGLFLSCFGAVGVCFIMLLKIAYLLTCLFYHLSCILSRGFFRFF